VVTQPREAHVTNLHTFVCLTWVKQRSMTTALCLIKQVLSSLLQVVLQQSQKQFLVDISRDQEQNTYREKTRKTPHNSSGILHIYVFLEGFDLLFNLKYDWQFIYISSFSWLVNIFLVLYLWINILGLNGSKLVLHELYVYIALIYIHTYIHTHTTYQWTWFTTE
jgi:hypothetical protein